MTGLIKSLFDYLSLHLLRQVEIRYRLFNSFILLLLLPLLVSGYISYVESSKAIEERTRIFSTELVRQVSKNVQLRMAQIDSESAGLVLSDRVQNALTEYADNNESARSAARLDLTHVLLDHYGASDYINQKYFLDKSSKIVDTQVFAQLTRGVVRFVDQASDLRSHPHWGSYDNGVGQQNLGMVRAIINKNSNIRIGSLFLAIRPEHFSAIFDNVDLGSGSNIFILDASNNKVIVWPQGKPPGIDNTASEPDLAAEIADIGQASESHGFVTFSGNEQDKYRAAYARIPDTTWFVVNTIPERKLTAEAQSVRNKMVVIGFFGFLFSIVMAFIISRSISAPLKELMDRMHETGNLVSHTPDEEGKSDFVESKSLDELGRLALSFARMNDAVNQKIQQINEINASLEHTINERTAALVASEQETRTLIENSPDTIARYDRDCRRIFVNPAFGGLAEGGVASLVGKKPSEVPGGPNSLLYEAKIYEVLRTGKNTQFELKWPDKDGNEICSHIRLTAERDVSGTVISVLGVGRDITQLNEYRNEIEQKELAKSRFLAAAGHDLRQPLAAANLFIDALKFTKPSAEQNQIIQRMEQAMSTFHGLLEALLNISKLDAGAIKPEYTSINVAELVDWLEQSFVPMASEKKLGFRLHFPMNEELAIRSDIGLVKSILMNLVSNAIKFTSKGAILVSVRRRGEEVLIQVWDTGMGIPEDHIKRIYDEFYQINNPQRDRTGGLGLGLSIAKRAISLLGGKITCHSRVGHGSVFGVLLPLDGARNEMTQHVAPVVPQHDVNQAEFVRGKHFVVLEDDALVAEAICKTLRAMGGEVKYLHNAEDALQYANIDRTDYYIVDYMLGGTLNGIQFLDQLRQNLDKPIHAVLLTGDTSPTFVREAADCVWPVIYKPANINQLLSKLLA